MTIAPLACRREDGGEPIQINDAGTMSHLLFKLRQLHRTSTLAAHDAAQYWADVAVTSKSPLAPLAHAPGMLSVLWTPDIAPTTAVILGGAGYGFAALPRHLIHFTTQAGAAGIARTGMIRASRYGLDGIFGAGVYMARIGRPLNGFIDKVSRIPIHLPTPAGTVRIVPYLVYVRWGTAGVKITP